MEVCTSRVGDRVIAPRAPLQQSETELAPTGCGGADLQLHCPVMVKIRLRRVGRKRQPSYRVVVADERSPRNGRFIEAIGKYDPRAEPSFIQIDNERALDWLRKGAQPSAAVKKLLEVSGVIEQLKSQPKVPS